MKEKLETQNGAAVSSSDIVGLPQPFSSEEWYALAMCASFTLADRKKQRGSMSNHEMAGKAMSAMKRVIGEKYADRIMASLPNAKLTCGERSEPLGAASGSAFSGE